MSDLAEEVPMNTKGLALALPAVFLCFSAALAQADGLPQNCNVTLVLHAVSRDIEDCNIDACPPSTEVDPGDTVRIYLVARHYDNFFGVQTAFSWPETWVLLEQSWNCQAGQIVLAAPGPQGGTLATAFPCLLGPGSAVIGWLDFAIGGFASGGCLIQTEPDQPFGTHVVNCAELHDRLVGHVSPVNRGSICLGGQGIDSCEPETNWEEVTTPELALDRVVAGSWGDYDGDRDPDLYVVRMFAENRLFMNQAGLLHIDPQSVVENAAEGRSAAWGDYDRDGDLDLYLSNQASANHLFRNDGGLFVEATPFPLGDAGNGQTVAWVDYNRDGWPDLFLVNAGGDSSRLFRNDGNGFTDVPMGFGPASGAAWGDYDTDGDLDLYLTRGGNPSAFFENDNGNMLDVTPEVLSAGGLSAAWGDYDLDGDLDLYLVVDSPSPSVTNQLFRNNGNSGFSNVTEPPLNDWGSGRGVTWVDYDNDGDLDLYVAKHREANKLFRNEGGGRFTDVENACLGWEGTSQSAAWADYDGDGKSDVLVANFAPSEPNEPDGTRLFRNATSATSYHWLEVNLEGVESDRFGVGARIRVVASLVPFGSGQTSQIHDVVGGGSYHAQGSLTAEFGLKLAAIADTVEVAWPSGAISIVTNVSADQVITITEPSGMAREPQAVAHAAHASVGEAGKIQYALRQSGQVRIRIFDVAGRLVRLLTPDGTVAPGHHEAMWDWSDQRGLSVPAGIYLYRVESGTHFEVGRLIRLK
jgi:FG-GAP-like repeat/ASPIC and UnbV